MKKDLDKLLSRTIITYLIILVAVFILKLFGLNYFGLDTHNKILNNMNNFVSYWNLENVWYSFTLYINTFIILAISCNDKSKKMKLFVLATMPLNIVIQFIKTKYHIPFLFIFTDLLYLFILSLCYIKFINKEKIRKYNISNYWLYMIISTIFQIISLITRNMIVERVANNFIIANLISFDYIILCLMTFELYFIKGGKSLWETVLGYSSDLLNSLKKLPKKLHTSYQSSKPKTSEDELANKIYLVLFWLYNIFTVVVILFIATLNDTFIECIFILSSFWINKGVFGKAFHLNKASTCFVVSSLSYYILNRLTWSVNISFLIPVILGIALSYITSKLMARKENIYLYRGMPEDKFNELIRKVTDNEEHIAMCKMFYVNKDTIRKIAFKFNYSEINIKVIKKQINDEIKELHK